MSHTRTLTQLFTTLLMALAISGTAAAQTSVDLNFWEQKGLANAGDWTVENGGQTVFQTINGDPTYFVSPGDFFNTTVNGSFLQDQSRIGGFNDNDFIGFVFGWNEPGDNTTDASFYLLNWKQGNQNSTEQGFRLARVNGTATPPFSNAEDDNLPNYDVLAINTGTGTGGGSLGWADNTEYDFELLYQANRIRIDVTGGTGEFQSGLTIFDIAPGDVGLTEFESGRFGFYNHSQPGVEYRSFTLTEAVLVTDPTDGGTLDLIARVGTSASDSVEITNAGGAGTLLNGTAQTAAGPLFSGGGDNFNLSSGSSVDVDYTYTPAARTLGTPDTTLVNISSDDPVDTDGHDITLSGIGVAPVFAADTEIDFDDIDFGQMSTLLFNISNTTTDGDLGDLTDLTLNDITIDGLDAALFSLDNFTPGITIAAGETFVLEVTFDGTQSTGQKSGFLTILTDEGAALAGDGNDYNVDLAGNVLVIIPEPASFALFGLGALALGFRRQRA